MEHPVANKPVFQSESSVITHPYNFPQKVDTFKMPTWGLIVVLIIAFFVLKYFIYLKDEQRHGK